MTSDEALKCLQICLRRHPLLPSLSDLQQQVWCRCWNDQTYSAIASDLNYNANYIRQTGRNLWQILSDLIGIDINRQNFKTQFIQYCYETNQYIPQKVDWGEIPKVGNFYGRTQELNQLYQNIVRDRCRLVTILGMGGIGKSTLIAHFVQNVTGFDYIIWRSLQNAPQLSELIKELLRFISDQAQISLPESLPAQISLLLKYLKQHRCLLILDNLESILESGQNRPTPQAGVCQNHYQAYQDFIQRLGEEGHQSCLVLTSREKPKVLNLVEATQPLVQSWQLSGLNPQEGQAFLPNLAKDNQDVAVWQDISNYYGGNPLALKILASIIHDEYQNDLHQFFKTLQQGSLIIDRLQALLVHQFQRLSDLERQIMYALAIKREAVSFPNLTSALFQIPEPGEILEALQSVNRRSLIEKTSNGFTQQPVVQEFITQRFVQAICQELQDENLRLFWQLPLLEATTKVYLKESQRFFILQPIAQFLRQTYPNLDQKLHRLFCQLRQDATDNKGYGVGNFINLLTHLETPLHPYDFSGLEIWQADLQHSTLHDVNFANASFQESTFLDSFGAVLATTFSHNGQLSATGDNNKEIRLYRLSDGQVLHHLQGHDSWVWTVAFSRDDRLLASGSDDYTVKLWNVATGECLHTLTDHQTFVHCLTFHPDGNTLITGSHDTTIKIWDIHTGQCQQTLKGHTNALEALAINPEGTIIASGGSDTTIKLWNLATGQCTQTLTGHELDIRSLVWSRDSNTLFSSSYDLTIRQWDIATGQCLNIFRGHQNHVFALALDPQGNYLASAGTDSTIRVWDLTTRRLHQILSGHNSRIFDLSWHPHQQLLASAGQDQCIKLWHPFTARCLHTWSGYTNSIWSVAFDPTGTVIASGSDDATIRLWDWRKGQSLQVLEGHSLSVYNVAFNPTQPLLASSGPDCLAKVWHLNSGECLYTLPVYTPPARMVAFHPQGHILATTYRNGIIQLVEVQTGQKIGELVGHEHNVACLAFTPDGQRLISGSYDNTVKVWQLAAHRCLQTFTEHQGVIWWVAVHPSEKLILSSSADGTIKLWDLQTQECLQTLSVCSAGSMLVATFHPQGNLIASGSSDQTVKLWDRKTGECIQVFEGHEREVVSVAFHPQENILASGSLDGSVKLWDVDKGKCFQTLRLRKPYEGMKITGVQLNKAQKSNLRTLGAVD